jgi:hypothetical protein
MSIKLHRDDFGGYISEPVKVRGLTAMTELEIAVYPYKGGLPRPLWIVETDDERVFHSLHEARLYLNRFFETATH